MARVQDGVNLNIEQTAREAGSAANKVVANKIVKYGALCASHIFLPEAVETAGTWNQSAIGLQLIHEIGRVQSQKTQERRCSCSSDCPLLSKGGMRSLSLLYMYI